jgi:hypothetical protein
MRIVRGINILQQVGNLNSRINSEFHLRRFEFNLNKITLHYNINSFK